MQAEMTEHLGYAKHDQAGNNSGNSRNGKTTKALKGDFGEMPLETPRDRNGTSPPSSLRTTIMAHRGWLEINPFQPVFLEIHLLRQIPKGVGGGVSETADTFLKITP